MVEIFFILLHFIISNRSLKLGKHLLVMLWNQFPYLLNTKYLFHTKCERWGSDLAPQ